MKEIRLITLLLLLADHLTQNRTRDVIAASDINDTEFFAINNKLAKIRNRDVTADLGIVKASVGILLDGSHTTCPDP